MSNALAMEGVFGTLMGMVSVIAIPSIVLYTKRRKLHPIAARPFQILIFHQILLYIYIFLYCLIAIIPQENVPCLLLFFMNDIIGVFIPPTYTIRIWLLLIRIKLTEAKTTFWQDDKVSFKLLDWLLHHQFLLKEKTLFLIYLGFNFLVILAPIVTVIVMIGEGRFIMLQDCEEQSDELESDANVVISVIHILLILIAGWKLRSSQDGHYIKQEFKITSVALLATLILFMVFDNIDTPEFSVKWLVLVIGMLAIFMCCSTYPVYLSYRGANKLKFTDLVDMVSQSSFGPEDECVTLQNILDHPAMREHLRKQLDLEFAAENLLFWEAVEDLNAYCTSEDKQEVEVNKKALLIFIQFIHSGAPLSVNVSYPISHSINSSVEDLIGEADLGILSTDNITDIAEKVEQDQEINIEGFTVAQGHIYELMEGGVFRRFVLTIVNEKCINAMQGRSSSPARSAQSQTSLHSV